MSAILLVQTAIVSNFYSSHFVIDDIDLNRSSVLRLLLSYLYLLHTSSPLLQNTTDGARAWVQACIVAALCSVIDTGMI